MVNEERITDLENSLIAEIKLARETGASDLEIGAAVGIVLAKAAGSDENLGHIVAFSRNHLQH